MNCPLVRLAGPKSEKLTETRRRIEVNRKRSKSCYLGACKTADDESRRYEGGGEGGWTGRSRHFATTRKETSAPDVNVDTLSNHGLCGRASNQSRLSANEIVMKFVSIVGICGDAAGPREILFRIFTRPISATAERPASFIPNSFVDCAVATF